MNAPESSMTEIDFKHLIIRHFLAGPNVNKSAGPDVSPPLDRCAPELTPFQCKLSSSLQDFPQK